MTPPRKYCKLCGDQIAIFENKRISICDSCRRVGSWGMFTGGAIVGILWALVKHL